jgi:type VI secretion system protein
MKSDPPPFVRKRCLAALLILALSLGAAGCGIKKRTRALFGGQLPLVVEVQKGVNRNSPIAVDVLAVYQPRTLDKLMELSAHDYFGQKEQLARDFPETFEVIGSWELVPGQVSFEAPLDYRAGADALLIYADYFDPGPHRFRLETRRQARLILEESGFRVEVTQ